MANIVSYNDLIELFEDIARRHYQINTFFLGRDWELENNNDLQYPVLQVYPEVAKMPINNWKEYKTLDLTFNVKVIDLTVPGEENERDVHSDTLRIAQDIVNELNQHPYYIRSNVSLMEDIDFTAIEEFEDDVTAGWQFNLKLRIINANTFCGMPMAELAGVSAAGPTSQGTIVNVQYLTCETLPDCPTIITIDETLVSLQDQIDNLPPSALTLAQVLLYGNSTGNTTITAGTNLSNILQVSDTVLGLSWNGVVGGNVTLDDTGLYLYHDTLTQLESQTLINIIAPSINVTGVLNQQSSLFTPGTYIKSDGYSGELTYFNAAMGALFNGIKTDSAQVWLNYESTTAIQSSGRIQLNDSNSLLQHDAQVSITSPLTYILGAFTQQQYPGGGGDGTTIYSDGSQVALRTETTSGQHNLIIAESGNGVALQVTDNLGTLTNTFQMTNAGIYIPNNGTNSTFYIDDKLERKGLVYYDDYSANFTPESLVSKRYVDTYYVPYTGATQDVDLGAWALNAGSIKVNGTNGGGHIHLKHQALDAPSQANSTT